ncbi:MAG: mechanosensitive ion channel family protein [Wenzhouxiangellaceae bacterium]
MFSLNSLPSILGGRVQDDSSGEETPKAPDFDVNEQLGNISDWLPDDLAPYWQAVENFPIIGAVIIVILAYLIAKLLQSLWHSLARQLTKRTGTDLDDTLADLVARPLFITIFFYGLGLATRSLGLPVGFTSVIIKILASLVIVSWLNALMPAGSLVLRGLSNLKERFNIIEERTLPLFSIITNIILIGMAAYALLIIWGINPAAWLASAGVVGIAVGFAARDTLANLFSGVFIVADAPYKIGDYINLDTGERGMVTHVGLRSTRLLTRDDVEITIPNAVIANAKIINESGGPSTRHRIRIKVGVAYGSDVDQVHDELMAVARNHDKVCRQPEARVRMRGFGDSSLDFELLCWIDQPAQRGLVSHELFMAVYKRLAEADIEIPFPKRDLYIKEMPAARNNNAATDADDNA